MSADDWMQELDKMLTNIERQAMSSLRNINNYFEQSGQSFHQAHQTYCLKRSTDRLNEVYSKFECESSFSNRQSRSVDPMSTDNNNSNPIIEISDDEDSDERPSSSSSEIKTEDNHDESNEQASVGEIPNVETKEEEEEDLENEEIPIVRVPANQLTRAYKIESNCSEGVKIESDEDHNKENIENEAKRAPSNSPSILDKVGDNNETNVCEPYGKKSRISKGKVESKDASRAISYENNENETNAVNISESVVEVNVAGNVRSGQSTLEKWFSLKNKSNGNKEKSNRGIAGQTKKKKMDILRTLKKLEKNSKISSEGTTHSGEKAYECDRCKKRFTQKSDLTRHMRTHKDSLFHCSGCHRGFSQNIEKEAHERDCEQRRYECYLCNRDENKKKFVTLAKAKLEGHMRIHTGEKPYKCDQCKKRFNIKCSLTMHIRTHTGEKPYQCDRCKKQFSQIGNLNSHMKTHRDNLFHCSGCHRGFSQNIDKGAHERECKRRRYECYLCNTDENKKKFVTLAKAALEGHMRIHTGEKPYKCDQCKKRFSWKNSLTSHIRTHTGEKPYQCDHCMKRFSRQSHRNLHMRTHKDSLFHCSGCYRGFTQNIEKEAHERECKRRRYECYLCNRDENKKKFVTLTKNAIEEHMRIHTGEKPYQCDHCKKRFSQKCSLTTHIRTHTGVKPHQCDQCKKRFNGSGDLTRHIRTHTGEKPYKCGRCKKRFSQTGNLKAHIKTHRE